MYLNAVFLSLMCCLHYYWFALFFKILGRVLTSGKVEDLGNKVETRKQK